MLSLRKIFQPKPKVSLRSLMLSDLPEVIQLNDTIQGLMQEARYKEVLADQHPDLADLYIEKAIQLEEQAEALTLRAYAMVQARGEA